MVVRIFDLDDDTFSAICGFLNESDLRAFSSVSRKGFRMMTPALVRTVNLSRSPQQVLDFCNFALKYELCRCIIYLTIFESAAYFDPPKNLLMGYSRDTDIPHSALFARAMAKVLERADNLVHLGFNKCIDLLLENEPRIANIICQRPPALSLELSWANAPSLRSFKSIAGLSHLKLQTFSPPKYCGEEEELVETVISNSIDTLETLSLGHAVPASLRSELPPPFSCSHVRHFSMFGSSVLPEKVALMFPNLQFLGMERSLTWATTKVKGVMIESPPLVQLECPPRTLWPNLRSFKGEKQLALNLSQHHLLRRISFMGYLPYTDVDEFTQLSDTLLNSDIRSLSLETVLLAGSASCSVWSGDGTSSIEQLPTLLDPLLSTLSHSANNLSYLSLHTGKNNDEIPHCLNHLIRTASLLAPLNNLRYVELGVMTWMGSVPLNAYPVEVSTKPEELVCAWMDGVPSLQYMELNVVHKDWEHTWWKVEVRDGTFRRVSEEEGLSAKNWFDLEEWK